MIKRHKKLKIKMPIRTKEEFKQAVKFWSVKIKVKPTQIRIQKMKKKWASCSTSGWVCFSTDILKESRPLQEYVIVHELLHFQVPNHGKLFKSMMNIFLPGWEEIEKERVKESKDSRIQI